MDACKKVKFRQVLSVFTLTFLPLLLLAIILGYYIYRTEAVIHEEHTKSSEVQFLTQVKRQAFHDFNVIFSDLTSLLSNHTLTSSLDSNRTAFVNLEEDMLSFSKSKHVYDQIRLIDLDGQELIRINNRNDHPEIVPKSALQNKGDRYYFNETLNLGEGDIYISPLDLNVENGQVEEPFKPMIRFGSVAFDKQGQKHSILLFNFLGEHLINELKTFGRELSQGHFMFLNSEGFWLSSHDPAQEWGFMFGKDITFRQKYQGAWSRIQQVESGQFETDEGLFTFVTIRPLRKHEENDIQSLLYIATISSSNLFPHDYSWKAVTLIPRDKLYAANRKLFKEILGLLVFLLLPMALVCWWSAFSFSKRKLIEIDLNINKDRLQLALDGSSDGLWDWDLVTNEVYFSPRWKELLGYEDHEIQNHFDEWEKRVHPEDLTLAKDAIQAHIEGKTPSLEYLHRLKHKDGSYVWILDRGKIVLNTEGKPIRMSGTHVDITERILTEAQLSASNIELEKMVNERTSQLWDVNEYLRGEIAERKRAESETLAAYNQLDQVFQTTAGGMRIVDKDFNVVRANKTLSKLTGVSYDQLTGSKCYETFPGHACHKENCTLAMIMRGEQVQNIEEIKQDSAGREFPCLINATPFRDNNGDVIGMIEDFRDLTERNRLESIARSVVTMNNLSYVFAGIRHELGNPTNSVKTTVAVLKKKIEAKGAEVSIDEIIKFLDRALNDVGRMEYLLQSMRSFNMFEKPVIVTVKTQFFMDNLISLTEEDFLSKGIKIELVVDPEAVSMRVDSRAMQQVMLNIMTNAADALEGNDEARINIGVSKLKKLINITVEDNGCGMSDADLEGLFKPFHTNKAAGTGLGMVLVQKMLGQMNGQIAVESTKGSGTCVTITLDEGDDT